MKNPEKVAGLITELKALAENDFELHRINVLEKDLTAPPTVEIVDDNRQKFNGELYYKSNRKNDGHFHGRTGIHRIVYAYYFGEIPKGFVIHHIDNNPSNNDISNLQLLTNSEHKSLHNSNINERVVCEVCGKTYFKKCRQKKVRFCSQKCANEFYHHQITKKCQNCGKEFKTSDTDAKFCSSKCYGESMKKAPLEKTCVICGKKFLATVKHPEKLCCSQECRIKRQKNTRAKNLQIFLAESISSTPVDVPPSDSQA